jgi:uncharacterized damage-inducible protein DinB
MVQVKSQKKTLNKNDPQKDIKRIKKILNDHFSGDPWIDTTISGTLKSITAKQAAEEHAGFNSIWQIVNHTIEWRKALLARVKDKPISVPDNNFICTVKDTSPKAWRETIKKFESSQKELIAFLGKSKDTLLDKVSPTSGYSYYELVLSILLHDTYHIGQIVLIKKFVQP